jgi:hypothetical protein
MATYFYVVLTKATPGREEEFHEWYDDQHLPDCVKVPGVKAARRYRLTQAFGPGAAPQELKFDSLTMYELEVDDPELVAREMSARADTPAMPLTDALARGLSMMMMGVPAGACAPPRAGEQTGE